MNVIYSLRDGLQGQSWDTSRGTGSSMLEALGPSSWESTKDRPWSLVTYAHVEGAVRNICVILGLCSTTLERLYNGEIEQKF